MWSVRMLLFLLVAITAFSSFSCDDESKSEEKPYYLKINLNGVYYKYYHGITDASLNPFAEILTPTHTNIYATPDEPAIPPEPANYVFIQLDGTGIGEYDETTADIDIVLSTIDNLEIEMTLTVVKYEEVGGVIEGNFSGTFSNDGGTTLVPGSGSFKVERIADDAFIP